jgi:hypothetical protein
MHLTWRQTLVVISSALAVFGPLVGSAQISSEFSGPPVVRMSGVLQPFDEQKSQALNMLTLTIADATKWLFQVNRIDSIAGMDPGISLLDRIFPPELRLMGAPTTLAPLEQPNIVGKTISLEGILYIGDRNYEVTTVNVAAETSQ